MTETLLGGRVLLHCGDCRAVLAGLEPDTIDAVVTDPPYALAFMGKAWDHAVVAFDPATWVLVHHVLKPGGHLLAMGGTRTYHRLACAIEDAGFEIRDTISWLYGSGFPKSHNVGNGWGTALKPACELIVLARKPLSEGTVAANVLRWGTGAINVDGCRVDSGARPLIEKTGHIARTDGDVFGERRAGTKGANGSRFAGETTLGRWPANVAHDGSDEVTAAFPDREVNTPSSRGAGGLNGIYGYKAGQQEIPSYGDTGSAARFFYTAKADADDRLGSKHPTVKPLDLMQWLVRMVTPKGGTVLDPFAGTGTMGEAAWREGAHAVLIEAEAEYQADIRRRMALALAGPDERSRESVKAKGLPYDPGPLFGGTDLNGGHVRKIYGKFEHDKTGKRYDSWAEMWSKPFDFSREPTT